MKQIYFSSKLQEFIDKVSYPIKKCFIPGRLMKPKQIKSIYKDYDV